MKFLILNGPNLNLLGSREPGIYGSTGYEALCTMLKDKAAAMGAEADCVQSNHEGALIDAIHGAVGNYDAISMKTCVEMRNTIGAPGKAAMEKVIKAEEEYLSAE